jgi:periplasmic divalent cation tolerance protein
LAEFVTVSTNTDDRTVAEEIARSIVENRLAACAGISLSDTVYHWDGVLCSSAGFVVCFETTSAAASLVEAEIIRLHPEENPKVLVSPILGGSEDYLAWIRREAGTEASEAGPEDSEG